LTLARTRLRPENRAGRATTAVLMLASNAPDVDIVAALTSGPGSYMSAHRGPTHGPLGIVSLALACAVLVHVGERLFATDDEPDRGLDGVRPIDSGGGARRGPSRRDGLPTTWDAPPESVLRSVVRARLDADRIDPPVVHPHRRRGAGPRVEARQTLIATAVLGLIVVTYALHAAGHRAAVRTAGGSSAWALETWSERVASSSLAAVPTFAAPVLWRIVQPAARGYDLSQIDVSQQKRAPGLVLRSDDDRWTAIARGSRLGRIYLGFSRFPVISTIASDAGVDVRFEDARFVMNVGGSRRGPLTATVRIDRHGTIVGEWMGSRDRRRRHSRRARR
jgi:hypothetical protein